MADAISICTLLSLAGVVGFGIFGIRHDLKNAAKITPAAATLGYEHLQVADDFVAQNLSGMHRFHVGRVSHLFTGPSPTFFVHNAGKQTEGRGAGPQLVAAQKISLPVFVLRRRPPPIFGWRGQAVGPVGMPRVPLQMKFEQFYSLFSPEPSPELATLVERALPCQDGWEVESDGQWLVVMRIEFLQGSRLEHQFAWRREVLDSFAKQSLGLARG